MAKIQVIVSPYLVSEDELRDAAKEVADELLECDACRRDCSGVTPDDVRRCAGLTTWVGIPAELIHAIRVEILERTARPAPIRRLGDYCPS